MGAAQNRRYEDPAERAKTGAANKGRIPWNKGLTKNTDARVAAISVIISAAKKGRRISPEKLKRKNATLRSPEGREKMSKAMKASSAHKASVEKRVRAGGFKAPPFGYRSGHRDDIGIFVRSSWEANYARYLNFLKQRGEVISWSYEPKRFYFNNIKRGTRSYLPDFKVLYSDGRQVWEEVKSYWTQVAKTAVKRFRKYYPEETLVIIDKDRYREIEAEFSSQIPKWEGKKKKP